jgi:hypothetical protein
VSVEVYIFVLILLILSFLLSRWLVRTKLRSTRRINLIAGLGAIFIAPAVYVFGAFVFFLFFFNSCERSRGFDRESWRVHQESRFEMREDIIESRMLIGLSDQEVQNMLGKPISENDDRQVYDMGISSGGGFGVIYHDLEVNFAADSVQSVNYLRVED